MGASSDRPGLLVHSASEVVTLAGGVRRGPAQAEIGLIGPNDSGAAEAGGGPAVAAYEGRIIAVGRLADVQAQLGEHGIAGDAVERVDAHGGTVTPGLIDPHTHLLFSGTRHAEVELRQRGHSYLEILAAGGGILQTVRMTRAASADELLAHGRHWLREMLSHGVTTIEAKSGYGLDTGTELRLLALLGQLGEEGPVEIVPTFLGAHAVAPEFRDRSDSGEAYLENVVRDQLPAVVEQGVATSCDVFCEQGVFDASQSRRLLEAASDLGLASRLHADQIHASGGAELAASIGALSADHLASVTSEGIEALARAAAGDSPTIATLLPLTSFYLADEKDAPARALIDAGVPVAIGTDFNPGTSPAPNAQLALAFAVHRLRMTAAEALAAMTINAAAALGLANSHGSLDVGKSADMTIWNVDSHAVLPYWLGADLVQKVIKAGRVAYSAA